MDKLSIFSFSKT